MIILAYALYMRSLYNILGGSHPWFGFGIGPIHGVSSKSMVSICSVYTMMMPVGRRVGGSSYSGVVKIGSLHLLRIKLAYTINNS
jgi:hypothetical protein